MSKSRGLLLLASSLLGISPLDAQDLRQVQPQPAPPMPAEPRATKAPPPPPDAATAHAALSHRANRVIRGVVLLTAAGQVRPEGWPRAGFDPSGVDATRVPLIARSPEALRYLAGFRDRPVDGKVLSELPAGLHQFYAADGRRFVSITIPAQEFAEGILQVLVVEGKLGSIVVTGNRYFSEKSYLSALRARPGEPIDTAQLDADLEGIAGNPFRQATVAAKPGERVGYTDLVIQAEDRRPWRIYGGYDDTGNRATGIERINAGINWGNAFGLAHIANYRFTASPDLERSVAHSADYTIPIAGGGTFSLAYSYGKIRPDMPPPFDQTGRSSQTSLRFRQPLPDLGRATQAVSFGGDFKRSDNNLLFSSIPVSGNITHIWQLVSGYEIARPDAYGTTGFNASLAFSPGGLDDKNKDAAFNISRAGAESHYLSLNLGLTRDTLLPGGLSLASSISGQVADTNLLGSEQFTLGGAYTVRGYDDGDTYGDWGALLRNELRLPEFRGISRWFKSLPADGFTPLVFVEAGITGPTDPMPGEATSIVLASAGVGFRYSLGRYGSLRVDYGWQLTDSPRGYPDGGRLHVGATFSY